MSDSDPVILTAEGPIAKLTFNRPEVNNAFNAQMIQQITRNLNVINDDQTIRVLIIQANGKNFSAGADVNWMAAMANASESENKADAMTLASLMHTLNNLRVPTIAKVHGAVYGGGVGLLCCSDIVTACDDSIFCLSEVKLGMVPAVISPYVVAQLGERQVRRFMLTAETFDASQAHNIGLIHSVVKAESLDNTANKYAEHVLKNGPVALQLTKRLIQAVVRPEMDQGVVDSTADLIAKVRVSEEGQEGLQAFIEKRKPNWVV